MPMKPRRGCRHPGCPNLCDTGVYCALHQTLYSDDARRGGGTARGYDAKWRKARAEYLAENRFCVECKRQGVFTPATVIDHIKPHRGDAVLFWDRDNWQALCKACHDKKTGSGL